MKICYGRKSTPVLLSRYGFQLPTARNAFDSVIVSEGALAPLPPAPASASSQSSSSSPPSSSFSSFSSSSSSSFPHIATDPLTQLKRALLHFHGLSTAEAGDGSDGSDGSGDTSYDTGDGYGGNGGTGGGGGSADGNVAGKGSGAGGRRAGFTSGGGGGGGGRDPYKISVRGTVPAGLLAALRIRLLTIDDLQVRREMAGER